MFFLIALGLLQLLPRLGDVDFHREEGRRVLPAREMLASGDWVTPTLWGEPYLSKPPGIFWLQAGAQWVTGEVTAFASRMVSVLATLATLIALYLCGRRWFSARAGLLAALCFLASPEVLTKGRLAEIEAPLALSVFLATHFWWRARESSLAWAVASGLALAAAILLKGPAALIFFLGPPLLLAAFQLRPKEFLDVRLAIALALGLALPGIWVFAVFESVGAEVASSRWGAQVTGQGGRTLAEFLKERPPYLLGVLFGGAPMLWILLTSSYSPRAKNQLESPIAAAAYAGVIAGFGFFLFFPGTSVRYFYPALPFVALLAGAWLDRAFLERESRPTNSEVGATHARHLENLSLLLAGSAGLVAIVLWIGSVVTIGDIEIDVLGIGLGLALAVLAYCVFHFQGKRRILLGLLAIPLVFAHVLTTQVDPAKAERHSRAPIAAEIAREIGEDSVLHVGFFDNFNTLIYLDNEVRLARDWRELRGDAWLLLSQEQFDVLMQDDPSRTFASVPKQFEIRGNRRVLAHLREAPASAD